MLCSVCKANLLVDNCKRTYFKEKRGQVVRCANLGLSIRHLI